MRIGIGLPVTTIGASGELLIAWARGAEERGFESLGAIDRIAYPALESMTSLAVPVDWPDTLTGSPMISSPSPGPVGCRTTNVCPHDTQRTFLPAMSGP